MEGDKKYMKVKNIFFNRCRQGTRNCIPLMVVTYSCVKG